MPTMTWNQATDSRTGRPTGNCACGGRCRKCEGAEEEQTDNGELTPHDASRRAVLASIHADHRYARMHGLKALEHSREGDSESAADRHARAERHHLDAAQEAEDRGKWGVARTHRRAAHYHKVARALHTISEPQEVQNMTRNRDHSDLVDLPVWNWAEIAREQRSAASRTFNTQGTAGNPAGKLRAGRGEEGDDDEDFYPETEDDPSGGDSAYDDETARQDRDLGVPGRVYRKGMQSRPVGNRGRIPGLTINCTPLGVYGELEQVD